jgi:hypothetical protein
VQALGQAASKGTVDDLRAIFGPDGKDLVDVSDPVRARQNRETFAAAMTEGWRLVDDGARKVLIVGNEAWPFPVPLVHDTSGWRFDTAAGEEEVLSRRIGRNELSAIQVCRTYVAAQRRYAEHGHDGQPAGLYAATFRSVPGKQNGLYWRAGRGQPRSPLGDLLMDAEGHAAQSTDAAPKPFRGYFFRILTAQGSAAAGGAKNYVAGDRLAGGFALIAWPAQYDRTGVMTFIVNRDGVVHQKDLGPGTDAAAERIVVYDPDASWSAIE